MTSVQKIIKYFALAFAAVIIVSIITASLTVVRSLVWLTGKNNSSNIAMQNLNIENSELGILNINVTFTNLIIKQGDELKAETNNELLVCNQDGNKLDITEKEKQVFQANNEQVLTIYIPENMAFEKVYINIGAGKANINYLKTRELDFEIGAGKAEIKNLTVQDNAKIEGGAGKVSIESGDIKNLNLEIGAGEAKISSKIAGNSKIEAGVGSLNINITDNKENYKIKTNKGLGSIKVDGKETNNEEITGNGENYIDVTGGVGTIKIDFE